MPEHPKLYPILNSSPELREHLLAATADIGTALGLVRVLTLLPLFDPALTEVERLLARSWDALRDVRRVLDDQRVTGERDGLEGERFLTAEGPGDAGLGDLPYGPRKD